MHWVYRGEEPVELESIRIEQSPGWIKRYHFNIGKTPRDNDWNQFIDLLGDRFHGLCGYCEDWGKSQIDHFRPKSKFPQLVYDWSNWVYSCIGCNFVKHNKWPSGGLVNPCANVVPNRPERYFRFDTASMEILPRDDQSEQRKALAKQTINDLSLNDFHHLRKRSDKVKGLIRQLRGKTQSEIEEICADETASESRLSSVAKAWLVDNGF